jgi:hypothetical protein
LGARGRPPDVAGRGADRVDQVGDVKDSTIGNGLLDEGRLIGRVLRVDRDQKRLPLDVDEDDP